MKIQKIYLTLAALILPLAGASQIIETSHIADVIPLIEDDAWLLVDLENTLFISRHKAGIAEPLEADFVPSLLLLQERHIVIMGLTQRKPSAADHTITQVASLGFDFKATAPAEKSFIVPTPRPCVYKQGILFVGAFNPKGKSFIKFLAMISNTPKKVVFIDDKRSNVEEVERVLAAHDIECIGVHYTAKEYVKSRIKSRKDYLDELE